MQIMLVSKKYNREDIRDILERSSARETAARVAAGAVARQFLEACGIKIVSHVINIGGVKANTDNIDYANLQPNDSVFKLQRCSSRRLKCAKQFAMLVNQAIL